MSKTNFILYNLGILFLNLILCLFLFVGFIFYDPEMPNNVLFIKNFLFCILYILIYSTKFLFFPILFKFFIANRSVKYLQVKFKRSCKLRKQLLCKSFLFDYLILLIASILMFNKNILLIIIGPIMLVPFFYYLGGGVFLSYLGLVAYLKYKNKTCLATI